MDSSERLLKVLTFLYPFRGEEFYYPSWILLRQLDEDNLTENEYYELMDTLEDNGYAVILKGQTDYTTFAIKITSLGVDYLQKASKFRGRPR
jgi:hypothetical protein